MISSGIPDESTKHLHSLIRKQKSTGRNSKLITPQAAENRKPPVKPLIPNAVRVRLKDLLSSYVSGIDGILMCKAYGRRFGHDLNYQELGFRSLKQFLQQLPDILRMVPVGPASVTVYPVKENIGKYLLISFRQCFSFGSLKVIFSLYRLTFLGSSCIAALPQVLVIGA